MMDGKKSNSMANRIEAMMLANQMIDNERKFNQFIKEKQDNAILQLAMVAFGIRDAVIVFTQGGCSLRQWGSREPCLPRSQ